MIALTSYTTASAADPAWDFVVYLGYEEPEEVTESYYIPETWGRPGETPRPTKRVRPPSTCRYRVPRRLSKRPPRRQV